MLAGVFFVVLVSVLADGETQKTTIMANLKNILRCYAMGIGMRSIANTFHLSRNTVRRYIRWYQTSCLSMDQVMRLPEERLQELVLGGRTRERRPSPRQVELEALLPEYAKRLNRKGVTMKSLYEEFADFAEFYNCAVFPASLEEE